MSLKIFAGAILCFAAASWAAPPLALPPGGVVYVNGKPTTVEEMDPDTKKFVEMMNTMMNKFMSQGPLLLPPPAPLEPPTFSSMIINHKDAMMQDDHEDQLDPPSALAGPRVAGRLPPLPIGAITDLLNMFHGLGPDGGEGQGEVLIISPIQPDGILPEVPQLESNPWPEEPESENDDEETQRKDPLDVVDTEIGNEIDNELSSEQEDL